MKRRTEDPYYQLAREQAGEMSGIYRKQTDRYEQQLKREDLPAGVRADFALRKGQEYARTLSEHYGAAGARDIERREQITGQIEQTRMAIEEQKRLEREREKAKKEGFAKLAIKGAATAVGTLVPGVGTMLGAAAGDIISGAVFGDPEEAYQGVLGGFREVTGQLQRKSTIAKITGEDGVGGISGILESEKFKNMDYNDKLMNYMLIKENFQNMNKKEFLNWSTGW